MAIVLTGTKTVTRDLGPHLKAATLTALLATAVENLTLAQLRQIEDALSRVSGADPNNTIGSLLL